MADELKMQIDLVGFQRFVNEYLGRGRETPSRMTSILNPLTGERVVVDLAKERGRLRQRVGLQPLPLGEHDDEACCGSQMILNGLSVSSERAVDTQRASEAVVLPCDVEPGSS